MVSKTKIFALTAALLAIIIAVFYWELISYGVLQGKGQLKIIMGARPVAEVLIDGNIPDSIRSRIRTVAEIKEFATELGLNPSDNYETFYDQEGKPVLWNLSACKPYALEAVEWTFPFLGSFSYKGFFDLAKAKEERDRLKEAGYDTQIRTVGAWSTLGWFKDPILSNFLNRSEGDLAETILHELTHGTIFVKDSLEFNENLASFIGEQGAVLYLKQKFGENSVQISTYFKKDDDSFKYRQHILSGKDKLQELYREIRELPDDQKDKLKTKLIDEIVMNVDTIAFEKSFYYDILRKNRPNNAYFMMFQRYHAKEDNLSEIFEKTDSDLKKFILEFKSKHGVM